jgi:hypothetical protein
MTSTRWVDNGQTTVVKGQVSTPSKPFGGWGRVEQIYNALIRMRWLKNIIDLLLLLICNVTYRIVKINL